MHYDQLITQFSQFTLGGLQLFVETNADVNCAKLNEPTGGWMHYDQLIFIQQSNGVPVQCNLAIRGRSYSRKPLLTSIAQN